MTRHTTLSLNALAAQSRRVRLMSLSLGALIGMWATVYLPQVHAAATTEPTGVKAPAKPKGPSLKERKERKVSAAKKAAVAAGVETKLAPLPEASGEQIAAAQRVLIGKYECEFKKSVLVDRNDANPGYVNLTEGRQVWVMKPVVSSTGTIRLEDTRGEALMLQIATKSMLMNVKTGQRMVDGCMHEVQRVAMEEMRRNPPPSVFNLDGKSPPPAAAAATAP
ncbi:hypothetical protein EIP75_20135 [Aquabacterium soli]|uniref:Uncharacterized protein n=1 Tax=Aquabacterium soli TaxID=2493092 RepID=A0A3R8YKI3_9BURK|nr:hypothetical protein [Aquabacterium soli]RRS02523.1 hypothetical protein EIP75_20135 [Aquabacterium soli]